MYKDAKEELKRLEDALLAEDAQTQTQIYDMEKDEEEDYEEILPRGNGAKKAHTVLVVMLLLGIAAVLVYWFVCYGGQIL